MNIEEFKIIYQKKMDLGLDAKQFCEKHSIKLHVYNYWLRKLRNESQEDSVFVELKPKIDQCEILAKLPNGISIEVPLDYNENHLLKLISTLSRC